MAKGRASLQHLQVLQASRPLEASPACLGSAALGEPKDFAEALPADDGPHLREAVRKGEFWISLLEGEQSDLSEQVAKHKQRHQLALRQCEAKASALREAEAETKSLRSEIDWLRKSQKEWQDTARLTSSRGDAGPLSRKVEMLEAELAREREERTKFESQLVTLKVRHAEVLQKVDSQGCALQYYEDQLRVLNPNFEPADLSAFGQWLRPAAFFEEPEDSGGENDAGAGEQPPEEQKEKTNAAKRFAGGLGRKLKAGMSKIKIKRKGDKDEGEKPALCDASPTGGSPRLTTAAGSPKDGAGAPAEDASSSPSRRAPADASAAAAAAKSVPASVASPTRRPRWDLRRE